MRESQIMQEIRLRVSQECPGIVLRLNSGKAFGGDKIVNTPQYGRVLLSPRAVALCPPGTPDLVYFGPCGDTVFLEVKNEAGKTREAQERFLKMIKNYGFSAAVVRSADEAVNYINDPKRRKQNA